jgi:hypothetical protein
VKASVVLAGYMQTNVVVTVVVVVRQDTKWTSKPPSEISRPVPRAQRVSDVRMQRRKEKQGDAVRRPIQL